MSYHFDLSEKISVIDKAEWDTIVDCDNPFARYDFLHALEESGCVSHRTGWQPLHLRIFKEDRCVAVAPLYLKSHSYGEYVFDFAWAEAYERNSIDYYPKLITAFPFSPISHTKLFSLLEPEDIYPIYMQCIKQLCSERNISSWHGLFLNKEDTLLLENIGCATRLGTQYHWFNRGYTSFDDFLERFSSRRRKNVKRERRKVLEQNISLETIEGVNISPQLLNTFYQCYTNTYLKRGRQPYLNPAFFQALLSLMPENIVLFAAKQDQTYIATALCFKSSTTLFGRYWGSIADYDCLHFETCFYQGIEYCIQHYMQRFDPGAQGEHKIIRGFEPITTHSSHYIEHPTFRHAINTFCKEESQYLITEIQALSALLPFKDIAKKLD